MTLPEHDSGDALLFVHVVYDQVPPNQLTAQAICGCLWSGPQRTSADCTAMAATDAYAHHLREGHIVVPNLIDGINWPAGSTTPQETLAPEPHTYQASTK
ncbi:Uncharacterised protein [Mycobacteroides abscessus subsp. abscessus]|uniref:hypothetical protein n=1 Tax=Mycobacteroides abscessus TaxID=36809 RepID=UPI000926848C|nr:hypothetical protein [Mycobacteroides abscessus]MBL3752493.1 hypothetical protein [Mycobacteroides abscessus subsp. massiliense]SIJ24437.1 Uncharacterised protein [Mycobacteroides abscessus subsp. abscessus]SIN13783.1 Uncharacterised protein [Mycobacteroides abscessus subsp. abscessus]